MGRRRLWLLLGVGLLLVGATGTWIVSRYQKQHEPRVPIIPAAAEVSEMRISLSKNCFGSDGIAEFVVPERHVPVILGWLRPDKYIRDHWRLDWLAGGDVVIKTTDGGEVRVRFYDAGVNPAVLTTDGVDQFYGPDYQGESRYGAIGFSDAVYAAYCDSQRQGNRD